MQISTNQLGQAAENLVRAELLARGFEITLPGVPGSNHDLYVRLNRGWRSIQVKLGIPSKTKIARLHRGGGTRIYSDLLAIVNLPTKRIRWIARRGCVPKALQ